MARITATKTMKDTLLSKELNRKTDGLSIGHFLNLSCGHNNQFSSEEKKELGDLLVLACEEDSHCLV